MEIERKWMVKGWPDAAGEGQKAPALPLLVRHSMRQGYISVRPTVRIREEKPEGKDAAYILCFKSAGGLAREEIEIPLPQEDFDRLEAFIGLPLIPKERRTYLLPDGLHLEVSLVDRGLATEFMYAEIEYETVEQARAWDPASAGLAEYLDDEVTGLPGQSMGAYWLQTRGSMAKENAADDIL